MTAASEGVDGYCVCDSVFRPARDCGIPAHRKAARGETTDTSAGRLQPKETGP